MKLSSSEKIAVIVGLEILNVIAVYYLIQYLESRKQQLRISA